MSRAPWTHAIFQRFVPAIQEARIAGEYQGGGDGVTLNEAADCAVFTQHSAMVFV